MLSYLLRVAIRGQCSQVNPFLTFAENPTFSAKLNLTLREVAHNLMTSSAECLLSAMKQIVHRLVLIVLLIAACVPALADNSYIPDSLWSWRDRLLHERQELLSDRADCNTRLAQLDGYRIQIDKALGGNPWNRQELLGARASLLKRVDDVKAYADAVEKDLIDNQKDLALIESEMERYACIR